MILGPNLHREAECEAVLRSVPQWFGIEESLREYVAASRRLPTFAWEEDRTLVGFLSLKEHFPQSWEISCIAVRNEARGQRIGSKLLAHAEHWLRRQGVRLLQVKTLADQDPSPEYAETRRFYVSRGFMALEVFPELWSPANPALQMVKVLNAID
ncbi:MAG: GNAT family N-acetyltransferase [Betaproteobacteria bacterium]